MFSQGGIAKVAVSAGGTAYKDITLPIIASNLIYGAFVSTTNPNTRLVSFADGNRVYVYSTVADANAGVLWLHFGKA